VEREGFPVEDLRLVIGWIGQPSRISAEMPELRYHWDCGCCVVVDSDAMERRWTSCGMHQAAPRIRALRAS
jgi:hypothetical protein